MRKYLFEKLSIPVNSDDPLEKQLYRKLDKNYDHADRIVRWYRDAKRRGENDKYLKDNFINGLANTVDLLNYYDVNLKAIKKAKHGNDKVSVATPKGQRQLPIDAMYDTTQLRNFEIAKEFIQKIVDLNLSLQDKKKKEKEKYLKEKYRITLEDEKKIYLLDFSQHVACWVTEGPKRDTTNKLVYQLWQNDDLMDIGDDRAYGQPEIMSPFCTHSEEHWNEYENIAFPKKDHIYQQFWYFKKIKNVPYVKGNLSNRSVRKIFDAMKGTGPDTIICMNDSINELLDKEDMPAAFSELEYGDEIKKLQDKNFKLTFFNVTITFNNRFFPDVDTGDESDGRLFIKDQVPPEYDNSDISIDNLGEEDFPETFNGNINVYSNTGLEQFLKVSKNLKKINGSLSFENLDGNNLFLQYCPKEVTKDFDCSFCDSLTSLEGCPVKVGGDFRCNNCDSLKSLRGCPKEIGGDFDCSDCESLKSLNCSLKNINGSFKCYRCRSLKSLKGAPRKINGNFDCSGCKSLITLEGAPEEVNGNFMVISNPSLKSLNGSPEIINGEFNCSNCESLESLEGAPRVVKENFNCERCESLKSFNCNFNSIGGAFICSHCELLESLEGSPKNLEGTFDCSYCRALTSLKGSTRNVKGTFVCQYCRSLKNLEGAPEKVNGNFICSTCKSLESLEGAPKEIGKNFDCSDCISLKTLKGIPKRIGENFSCLRCKSLETIADASDTFIQYDFICDERFYLDAKKFINYFYNVNKYNKVIRNIS